MQTVRATSGLVVAMAGPPLLTAALLPVARPEHATSVAFAYLLVMLASARGGLLTGLAASVSSFVLFNFFFIEPLHSLTVSTRNDVGVLAGFLITAALVSTLFGSVQRRRDEAEQQAAEARLLYEISTGVADADSSASELEHVGDLVETWLDLAAVAVAVHSGDSLVTARAAGRSESELRRALSLPSDDPVVATAHLANGDDVALFAYAQPGRAIDERQRALLRAAASLTATSVDRMHQREQRRRIDVLQETDRQRSALLAAVSHDLRTPLAAISACAAALQTDQLSGFERTRLTQSITAEGERLARMVSNLLDLGRIEGGALVADREPVPVDELVGAVLARVRPRLGARAVTVDVSQELPQVLIDVVQIDQALGNLVDNVLAHTPEEAGLGVSAAARSGWVTVRVTDNGPGVPDKDAQRIFERFSRGSTARSGSGLGLAIARAYAVANGGDLEYVRTSIGSAFDLRLPAAEPPA